MIIIVAGVIEDLVLWENTTNESVLKPAREAIRQSWRETCELNKNHPQAKELLDLSKMPGLHDPFAGGGSIPLEAQRLGIEAYASDLNPVAVLINKAMIEIPPRFADSPPVYPEAKNQLIEARKRIGHLYPPIKITKAMAKERPDLKQYEGENLTVIAWLWSRTVKSPNPAFSNVEVPLASTFILSSNAGKESFVEPMIGKAGYTFTVRAGKPPASAKLGTSAGKRQAFRCLMSNVPMAYDYLREEGKAGRMGQKLMAIVAEGKRGRVYLAPTAEHEALAVTAKPTWKPDCEMPKKHRNFQPPVYGMNNLGDIFTSRQLVALTTFSDLAIEVVERIRKDAVLAGLHNDDSALETGGKGAKAYAEAVSVFLAFAISRIADYGCSISTWRTKDNAMRSLFSKQAVPMTWDFAEGSPFAKSSSGFKEAVGVVSSVLPVLPATGSGSARQADAQKQNDSFRKFISTDPPYSTTWPMRISRIFFTCGCDALFVSSTQHYLPRLPCRRRKN